MFLNNVYVFSLSCITLLRKRTRGSCCRGCSIMFTYRWILEKANFMNTMFPKF